MKNLKKWLTFNESDFGGNNFKEVINSENTEKSKKLSDLIDEIKKVKSLLDGETKGPLKTDYLNKFLDFYKEIMDNK